MARQVVNTAEIWADGSIFSNLKDDRAEQAQLLAGTKPKRVDQVFLLYFERIPEDRTTTATATTTTTTTTTRDVTNLLSCYRSDYFQTGSINHIIYV